MENIDKNTVKEMLRSKELEFKVTKRPAKNRPSEFRNKTVEIWIEGEKLQTFELENYDR
jgi:hypothetical protein